MWRIRGGSRFCGYLAEPAPAWLVGVLGWVGMGLGGSAGFEEVFAGFAGLALGLALGVAALLTGGVDNGG